jgi:hypothetical protein
MCRQAQRIQSNASIGNRTAFGGAVQQPIFIFFYSRDHHNHHQHDVISSLQSLSDPNTVIYIIYIYINPTSYSTVVVRIQELYYHQYTVPSS